MDILCEYSERGRLLTLGYIGVCAFLHPKYTKRVLFFYVELLLFAIWFAGYMISAAISFTSIPLAPMVLNVMFPLNESRERNYILNGEYMIDRRQHYEKVYLLEYILSYVTVFVTSAHDTTYAAIMEHCLGIFAIVQWANLSAAKSSVSLFQTLWHIFFYICRYRLQLLVNFSEHNPNFFGVKKKTDAKEWMVKTIRLHTDVLELSIIQCFQTNFRNYVSMRLIQLFT